MYAEFLIYEYNTKFNPNIILNCSCYRVYSNFKEYVFEEKRCYNCCFLIESDDSDRIAHLTLPVMLGSFIDFSIRQPSSLEDNSLDGAFIIDGCIKILPNFITNNLANGHIYISKSERSFRVNLRPDLRLHYTEGSKCVKLLNLSNTSGGEMKENWLDAFKNSLYRIPAEQNTWIESEYINYFECFLRNGPQIDDLSNKVVITPVTLLERAISILSQKMSSKLLTPRLRQVFSSGNLHFVLSSKSFSRRSGQDSSSLYITVEGHKIKDASLLTSMVKRYTGSCSYSRGFSTSSPSSIQNTRALLFPDDAHNFLCPLSTKEMKNAGETLYLSYPVVISQDLSKNQREVDLVASLNGLCVPTTNEAGLYVVLDGSITSWKISEENVQPALIHLKNQFPLCITAMKFETSFFVLSTTGGIPIRYSTLYEVYVSPYEAGHIFLDAFKEDALNMRFSSFVIKSNLHTEKLLPSKATVTINNNLGSCNSFCSKLNEMAFEATSGYKSALVLPVSSSTVHREEVPSYLKKLFKRLKRLRKENSRYRKESQFECVGKHTQNLHRSFKRIKTSKVPLLRNSLTSKVNEGWRCLLSYCVGAETLQHQPQRFSSIPELFKINLSLENTRNTKVLRGDLCAAYENVYLKSRIEKKDDEKQQQVLLLNVAFGDICGGTVEDGVVVDQSLSSENINSSPTKQVCVTLTIKFTEEFKTNITRGRRRNRRKLEAKYFPIHEKCGRALVFGVLVSQTKLQAKKSKNINVEYSYVTNHHRYLIYMEDVTDIKKNITSHFKEEISSVIISYNYHMPITTGTKIANNFGQKSVVSRFEDLKREEFKGYRADGTIIYPQILFSPQSIIGRSTAAQVHEMITSEEVAFTKYGGVIAPIIFNIHHIDSATQCKLSSPKNDLMTNENGFLANQLSNVSYCLSLQNRSNCVKDAFHFLQQLYTTSGCRIDPSF